MKTAISYSVLFVSFVFVTSTIGMNTPVQATPHHITGLEAHFHVTHIKFDKDPDDHLGDGLNIRHDAATELAHGNDGDGEWIKAGRYEPAAYVVGAGATNTIAVRIEAFDEHPNSVHKPIKDLYSAVIWAVPEDPDSGLPGVMEQTVLFDSGGVSYQYGSYVEFTLDDPFPDRIDKIVDRWIWHAKDLVSVYGTQWTTPPHTEQVDESGPHEIYTVLDVPGKPWYYPGDDTTEPWVSALEFTIDTAGAKGKTTKAAAAKRVVTYCFDEHGVKYDHDQGLQRFVSGGTLGRYCSFHLTNYMTKSSPIGGSIDKVNCLDQACAVQTMLELVASTSSEFMCFPDPTIQPPTTAFGYINATDFVGPEDDCNNPFFDDPANNFNPKVGPDDLYVGTPKDRSLFAYHAFVKSEGLIHDACVGPYRGEGGSLEVNLVNYANDAVDTSTNPEQYPNWPNTNVEFGDEANAESVGDIGLQ